MRELADALPISRPAVSRHLRLLKDAGLVVDRAEGARRLYRLHDEGIDAVRGYLEQVWGEAAARFRIVARQRRALMEPLELRFRVACPPERAFALWTAETSRWWPHGHSVSGAAGLSVIFEPCVG